MITEQMKTTAIARIKMLEPPEDVALDMCIPVQLIREWADTISGKDMVQMKANIIATSNLAQEMGVSTSKDDLNLLRAKLEESAITIATEVALTVATGDVVAAKTIQLCADAVTKLYNTFINGDGRDPGQPSQNGKAISAFAELMKD